MRTERIRIITEIALSVALAGVLSLWKITLPWNFAGGSISLVMLPIFVIALRRGVVAGVVTGLLFGVVDYFLEPWFVHPVQVALDYGVAFAGCGLAGLGAASIRSQQTLERRTAVVALIVSWVAVGGAARFAAAVLSGVVFFGSNAPAGQPVLVYSVLYNASYLLPSLAASMVLTALVVPALERAVPLSAPHMTA